MDVECKESLVLKDKVIVVTGGAGLIGKKFCQAIGLHGGIPIIADLNKELADVAVNEMRSNGIYALSLPLDICNKESIDNAIEHLSYEYGRIYGVVNNAYPRNKNYGRPLEEVEYTDFCENLSHHLGGYFLVSQCFSKHFRQYREGVIINMGSIYGLMAPRFEIYEGTDMTMPVEYAAMKAGIIHMTQYFAKFYKKEGVRCNCISPGGVRNNQPDQFIEKYNVHCGKTGMLDGDDLVGGLIFLLSDKSRSITGHNLIIDDGFSL